MKIGLNQLTVAHVSGLNSRAIEAARRQDPACKQEHRLTRPNELAGCLGAIFHQGLSGYVHLPLEKMAGLLLHRISQGQYFFDGNKRTGVLACAIFLQNHGLQLKLDRVQVAELVWGFAAPMDGSLAKYGEDDAIQFVFDNVLPRS